MQSKNTTTGHCYSGTVVVDPLVSVSTETIIPEALGVQGENPPPYAHSYKDNSTSNLRDFGFETLIHHANFEISGLGERGDNCGSVRASFMSSDGSAIKYSRMWCKRVACPHCWTDWARHRVFDMVVKIWGYHLATRRSPYFAVFTVPPSDVGEWSWEDVNTRLFRRGYRRGRSVGLDGGYMLFHPYRIRPEKKIALRKTGYGRRRFGAEAGLWQGVRKNALDLNTWRDYLNLSPHNHGIVFGDPQSHKGKDYVIAFKDDRQGRPEPKTLKEIIAYSWYLITHVGVKRDQETRATRSWGCLRQFDPSESLDRELYEKLCNDVAGMIGMEWSVDDGLHYQSTEDHSEHDWVDIWEVFSYVGSRDWCEYIEPKLVEFWRKVADRLVEHGVVELGDVEHPENLVVVGEVDPSADFEHAHDIEPDNDEGEENEHAQNN